MVFDLLCVSIVDQQPTAASIRVVERNRMDVYCFGFISFYVLRVGNKNLAKCIAVDC